MPACTAAQLVGFVFVTLCPLAEHPLKKERNEQPHPKIALDLGARACEVLGLQGFEAP